MMSSFGYSDVFVRMKVEDLLQEAENARMAKMVAGPQLPLRARIACWLVAAAERIEGRPQGSSIRMEAQV
jgi:hypothetical protein